MVAAALIVAIGVVGATIVATAVSVADAPGGITRPIWRPSNQDAAALLTLAAWQAIAIVLTLLASSLFGGRPRQVLALTPAGGPGVYAGAMLLMVGLQAVVSIVQYNVVSQDVFADLRPFVRLLGGSEWLLAFLVVGAGAPLSEELLFRGFLQSALAGSRLGFFRASLVTSALWTALHAGYSLAGILEVFLIGLFFSWLLWRTGSLRVAIFCHAFYNSLIVLVLRHVPLPG
jgi:membrane protease YdiL (CAAX protease family)